MKLFYSPASPFVRKVVVFAAENNLTAQIENMEIANTAIAQHDGLGQANPIGKIPTLILDDGSPLYDSRVICQYLDSLHTNAPFYPTDGANKWQVLRLEALCDGIADAAVAARYEQALRPDELFWDAWFQAQMNKVSAGIAALERDMALLERPINISHVAAACALNYVDFRHKSLNWQAKHPKLAEWLAIFNQRPSMQETRVD